MDQKKIGKYIAEKRKMQGLTQVQLAVKLNVGDKAVSKWERGISLPDVSKYQELCDILEISLNELFAGEDLDDGNIRKQADKNIIGVAKFEKVKRTRLKVLIAILAVALLAIGIGQVDRSWARPVKSAEHLGRLTYELPGDQYVHAKKDIITDETGFGNEEWIIGKIYCNKESDVKIIISEWEKQWHEFVPAIEYEKAVIPWAVEEYQGEKPDFIEQVAVFHDDGDEYYYKAYLMTDEAHDAEQYVLTVYGADYDNVRVIAESMISSMEYDDSLEKELVRKY